MRLDLLEKCYQANVGRARINMGYLDDCLLGGYGMAGAIREHITEHIGRVANNPEEIFYEPVVEHFGINADDAKYLFGGDDDSDPLVRLREYIDSHRQPTMDFKEPHSPEECLPTTKIDISSKGAQ